MTDNDGDQTVKQPSVSEDVTMPHQKITDAMIASQPYQDEGTTWFHDTDLAGFNLAIGKTAKTFYAAGESYAQKLVTA